MYRMDILDKMMTAIEYLPELYYLELELDSLAFLLGLIWHKINGHHRWALLGNEYICLLKDDKIA